MYNYKKLLALLMCLVMTVSFTACKKGSDSSDDSSPTSGTANLVVFDDEDNVNVSGNSEAGAHTSSSGESGKAGNESQSGNTSKVVFEGSKDPFANIPKRLRGSTVKFASWGDESSETYRKVMNAFTAKTGINVEIVNYSQDSYSQSVATQVVNNNSPDVVVGANFPMIVEILQPLQNIIDLSDSFWDSDITKMGTINGNSYLVNSWEGPWESVDMVYYNKELFTNNGLTTPLEYYKAGKWTYENYFKCAQEISALGLEGTIPNATTFSAQMGYPIIQYDPASQKFINNVKNVADGYKWKIQLLKAGVFKGGTWYMELANEQLGMFTTDLYGAKYNGYFSSMKKSALEMVPLPSSYNGKSMNQAVSTAFRAYGIAKGAKNPEGAAYFLRYFLDYKYYEAAKADVFKNDAVKKMYFDTVIPIYKNSKNRVFVMHGEILFNAGYNFLDSFEVPLNAADESQVDTIIASQSNRFDDAVNKANESIGKLK